MGKAVVRHEWSEEIPAIFYVLKNSPGSPPHCTTIIAMARSEKFKRTSGLILAEDTYCLTTCQVIRIFDQDINKT